MAGFADLGASFMEFDPANIACIDILHITHTEADSTSVALWSLDMDYFIPDHACATSSSLCDCFCYRSLICLRQVSCETWNFTRNCKFLCRIKPLDMGIRSHSYRCTYRVDVVLPKADGALMASVSAIGRSRQHKPGSRVNPKLWTIFFDCARRIRYFQSTLVVVSSSPQQYP